MIVDVDNQTSARIDVADVENLVAFCMRHMHLHDNCEVSVAFVEPDAMEQLHIQWMGLPGPTDVMSFPMDELTPGTADAPSGPGLLGDIIVCPDVSDAQAAAAGHSATYERDILLAHGVLHLLGYDHDTPDDEREMFALQRQLVDEFRGADAAR